MKKILIILLFIAINSVKAQLIITTISVNQCIKADNSEKVECQNYIYNSRFEINEEGTILKYIKENHVTIYFIESADIIFDDNQKYLEFLLTDADGEIFRIGVNYNHKNIYCYYNDKKEKNKYYMNYKIDNLFK